MAYIRKGYMDKNGRDNLEAYTHIESYLINVVKKVAVVNLVTYVSEKARDLKYLPIELEQETIKEIDYDNMFGENSLANSTTRNSDSLRVIYEKLNEAPKWKGDNIESVFEIIIKDKEELKKDEEISRKIAVEKELVIDVDFKVVETKAADPVIDPNKI
tara:strand:+ start:5658 stop:6134 length:477 start_codon:yes stop_codon:yes gene_type:complete